MGLRQRLVVSFGTDTNDQLVAEYTAAHRPVDHEADTAEHPSLGQGTWPLGKDLAHPGGEPFVVAHGTSERPVYSGKDASFAS